jgi:hypothetical protein
VHEEDEKKVRNQKFENFLPEIPVSSNSRNANVHSSLPVIVTYFRLDIAGDLFAEVSLITK